MSRRRKRERKRRTAPGAKSALAQSPGPSSIVAKPMGSKHATSASALLPNKDSIFSDSAQFADVTNSRPTDQSARNADLASNADLAAPGPATLDSIGKEATTSTANSLSSNELWQHSPWGVHLRTGRARSPDESSSDDPNEQWIELQRPYALIGPHPDCDIRLEDDRLPDVVYFCARVDDSIQVWPLCALAFSEWGTIQPGKTLFVGKTRIRFLGAEHSEFPGGAQTASRPEKHLKETPRTAKNRQNLIFDWGEGFVAKGIRRSVTIIGESHPSTLRLHGYGLQTCHMAVVEQNREVWVIDLDLSGRSCKSPLAYRLGVGKEAIRVGMVDVWLNQQGTPWNQSPTLRLGRAPHNDHVTAGKLAGESKPDAMEAGTSSAAKSTDAAEITHSQPTANKTNPASEQAATTKQEVTSPASIAKPMSVYRAPAAAEAQAQPAISRQPAANSWRNRPEQAINQEKVTTPLDDEGDPLSDRTIDRMIQRDAKAKRLRIAALIALAVLAVTVSVVILFGWVIPTFQNISG